MNSQAPLDDQPADQSEDNVSARNARAWLSALADGDSDPLAAERGCAAWRSEAAAREAWHTYHLIGDVLRSDELASRPSRDQDFLVALRVKLASEPVVFAPASPKPVAAARRANRWLAPAAAAAGFVVVAGVLVVSRTSLPQVPAAGPLQAQAPFSSGLTLATTAAVAPSSVQGAGGMIRDARLDAYLNAHQAARGGGAAALPGGALRSVEIVIPASAQR